MTDAIPHRLHRAWRATVYEADGIAVQIARDPRQPTLWRGRAAAVATLLDALGVRVAVFTGAWNPFSRRQPRARNRRALERLRQAARRVPHRQGMGRACRPRPWGEEHLSDRRRTWALRRAGAALQAGFDPGGAADRPAAPDAPAMKHSAAFLAAVFAIRAALGALFQAPGAAGPVLVPAFGMDWTTFGTLVGLFWLPGLVLALPLGLAARRLGDRNGVLLGLGAAGGRRAGLAPRRARPGRLFAGRLVMGVGTVLVHPDADQDDAGPLPGPDLFLAMAVYVLGWPIGIAAAQARCRAWRVAIGWQAPFLVAAVAGARRLRRRWPARPGRCRARRRRRRAARG